MHHHDNLTLTGYAQGGRSLPIEYAVMLNHLHFQIVIPRPQRPELINSPRDRVSAHRGRIGTGNASTFLHAFEVLMPAESLFDAPARALSHDVIKGSPVEA